MCSTWKSNNNFTQANIRLQRQNAEVKSGKISKHHVYKRIIVTCQFVILIYALFSHSIFIAEDLLPPNKDKINMNILCAQIGAEGYFE